MNRTILLSLILLSLSAPFCLAAAAPTISCTVGASQFTVSVTAVDPGTFHIVINQTGLPTPPASPFVVETTPYSGPNIVGSSGGYIVSTPAAVLTLTKTGDISLESSTGKRLTSLSPVIKPNDIISVALTHGADDRFYGAGNQSENVAGDLLHPSGNQIDSNGVTRIPYLWSTGGWSALVANDITGVSWNDIGGVLTWTVPAPSVDLYLSVGNDGYALLNAYSRLTGRAPIPPRWTFGYLQSRWGYSDSSDVQDKWNQFRERQIPVDAFIYDYDWFVNDWVLNSTTFPAGSLDKMKAMNLHFVGIRKPRVNDANRDFANSQGWLIKAPFGTDLRFDVPAAAAWWWSNQAPLVNAGVDGWWNDEAEQTPDEFFMMARTEYNGGRALNDRRPWSINRAFSPGMQRYGTAVWSGDIDSSWSALANQPGTLLNWGLAGMSYTGQDIGGFQSTPTPELYARWIEEGVFVPVMRAHGTHDSPRWPWAFGDDVLAATKKAIELRYRLIPYIYSFAAQTSVTGAPIIRPLFLEFPDDPKTFNLEDEWLLGSRLLAAPVLTQGGARSIYLPAGTWYDFNTGTAVSGGQSLQVVAPLDFIPSYVRSGSIIPLGPVIQSTGGGVEDPLEVRVYPGADAQFTLYEDDGQTYAYQTGAKSTIPFIWNDKTRILTVGERAGTFAGMLTTRHLVVTLPDGAAKTITYMGKAVQVHFSLDRKSL